MKPIEFDWREGTASVVWEDPASGIVRFHVPGDTLKHPAFRGVCFIKIEYKHRIFEILINLLQRVAIGNKYEFKAMVMRDGQPASKQEHRAVKKYLEEMGLSGISRRMKEDREIVKRY